MEFKDKEAAYDAAQSILDDLSEIKEAYETIEEQVEDKDFEGEVEIDMGELDTWTTTLIHVSRRIRENFDRLYEARSV